jgi:hypothetical protein
MEQDGLVKEMTFEQALRVGKWKVQGIKVFQDFSWSLNMSVTWSHGGTSKRKKPKPKKTAPIIKAESCCSTPINLNWNVCLGGEYTNMGIFIPKHSRYDSDTHLPLRR